MTLPTAKPAKSKSRRLSLNDVVFALNDECRWLILYELARGEPRMVKELAVVAKRSPTAVSKHLKELSKLGLVKVVRRAYELADAWRSESGAIEIDLGYCVLRWPERA